MRRAIVRAVLALLAIGLVLGGYVLYEETRFVVTVRNESQSAVATDIEIVLKNKRTEQRTSIKQIAAGESESLASLTPSWESEVDVRFKIGGEPCRHLNEYVEANRGYRIEIEIQTCTDVRSAYGPWPFLLRAMPWYHGDRPPQR